MNAARPGIPRTGVARFDRLAVHSEHFDWFIRGVKARGFRVRSSKLISPEDHAFIRTGNRTFYYNPDYMTVLDMLHELRHFQQLKQAGNLRIGGGALYKYEAEAYEFERRLGAKRGFSHTYMDYINSQLEWYTMRGRRNGEYNQR